MPLQLGRVRVLSIYSSHSRLVITIIASKPTHKWAGVKNAKQLEITHNERVEYRVDLSSTLSAGCAARQTSICIYMYKNPVYIVGQGFLQF